MSAPQSVNCVLSLITITVYLVIMVDIFLKTQITSSEPNVWIVVPEVHMQQMRMVCQFVPYVMKHVNIAMVLILHHVQNVHLGLFCREILASRIVLNLFTAVKILVYHVITLVGLVLVLDLQLVYHVHQDFFLSSNNV